MQHLCNHTPIKLTACKYKSTNAKHKNNNLHVQKHQCKIRTSSKCPLQWFGEIPAHWQPHSTSSSSTTSFTYMKIILMYIIISLCFRHDRFQRNTTHSFFPNPKLLGILLCKMGPEFRISICIKVNRQFKPDLIFLIFSLQMYIWAQFFST